MSTSIYTRDSAITYLNKLRAEFTEWYSKVSAIYSSDAVIKDLMEMRGYTSPEMAQTLKEIGVFYVKSLIDLEVVVSLGSYETSDKWGLTNDRGTFLLAGRYVLPIRDIAGRVTALVGWYPDDRKYVTTPTFGFSRDSQFFNVECYKSYIQNNGSVVFLVEGIFDTLSMRSLGYYALGNMGLDLSRVKIEILKRFKKVICIPDADKAGKSVIPFLTSERKRKKWAVENDCVFVKLDLEDVKDVDDLIKYYDCKDDLDALVNGEGSFITTIR